MIFPDLIVSEPLAAIFLPALVRLLSCVASHVVGVEHLQLENCSTEVANKSLYVMLL